MAFSLRNETRTEKSAAGGGLLGLVGSAAGGGLLLGFVGSAAGGGLLVVGFGPPPPAVGSVGIRVRGVAGVCS